MFTRPQTGQTQLPCPTAKEAKSEARLKKSQTSQRQNFPRASQLALSARGMSTRICCSEPGAEWLCSGPLVECEGTDCVYGVRTIPYWNPWYSVAQPMIVDHRIISY